MNFVQTIEKTISPSLNSKLLKFRHELFQEFSNEYHSSYASLHAPFDMQRFENLKGMANCYNDVSLIVLIGIGGSNLGTLAILEALYGKNYNSKLNIPILNAETTDSLEVSEIIVRIKQEVARGKKVLINCVSKSGGTTETIALFDIIEQIVSYPSNFKDYVVCTTQANSKLDIYAQQKGYKVIQVEQNVGGRYSVFSPVGIFPLMVCGINCIDLLNGAQEEITNTIHFFQDSNAINSAVQIYSNYVNYKCSELNLFLFVKQFEGLGKWYRQLIGESLGKEFDKNNKKVQFGITPLISLGSTDLHSMAQLFIGGPNRVYHQIITQKHIPEYMMLQVSSNQQLIEDIKQLRLDEIHNSIVEGLKLTFEKRNIKFDEFVLQSNSAFEIGKFMQAKMIEMMCLGHLFNVNPFNQPNVEEYKIETKEELKKLKTF